jgi:hypothetical protein
MKAPEGVKAPEGEKEERRSFIGQKARTTQEEKDTWNRRIRRWKRNQTKAIGVDAMLAEIKVVLALPEDKVTAESEGLRLWKFKASKALGADWANSVLKLASEPPAAA